MIINNKYAVIKINKFLETSNLMSSFFKNNTIVENESTKGYRIFVVALVTGGIIECPEYGLDNYQIIRASSVRNASDIYNRLNNCKFYYGSTIAELTDISSVDDNVEIQIFNLYNEIID